MYTLRMKLGKGFTLIELLIVITIIGILAVALVPKITGAPGAARDTARKTNLNSLAVAVQSYVNDNGGYPPTLINPNDKKGGTPECLATATVAGALLVKYLNGGVMITDPMKARSIDYGSKKCLSGEYYYIPLTKDDALDLSIVGYLLGTYLEGSGGNNSACFANTAITSTTCDSAADVPTNIKTSDSNTKGYIQYEVTS